jgi:alpha-beta hydrolase superfamily lysophospholipase
MRIVLYFILCYGLISFLGYRWQYRLLYFPDTAMMSELVRQAAELGLKPWPSADAQYRGFLSSKQLSDYKGTVIVFHGNAGSAVNRVYYVEALERLGYRVILAEYPGYGSRPGKFGEAIFVFDAQETLRIAFEEFGGPLYVWGESIGCGVATGAVAAFDGKIEGVILLTPWDTLPNLAQRIYWFLPTKWLVKDKYDNISNLRRFQGPVAVIMAGQDEIIPNRLTKNLYKSLSTRKKMWIFADARHNTWPTQADLEWWREVLDFISRHP